MQQILFLGSNNYKQVFHPLSKDITEMHDTRKIFPGVAMSLTLQNPHIHETGPLNTRSSVNIVASKKHSHKFPILASETRTTSLKTTTLNNPLLLANSADSDVRQEHQEVRKAGKDYIK